MGNKLGSGRKRNPCYGTTHADYLYGTVPCVRNLTKEEIDEAYEKNTGVLIADRFDEDDLDYVATPAVLCKNHGPFTWGKDAHEAVHNAVVLEEAAKMAARCEMINPDVKPAPQELQDKHYYQKTWSKCLLWTAREINELVLKRITRDTASDDSVSCSLGIHSVLYCCEQVDRLSGHNCR